MVPPGPYISKYLDPLNIYFSIMLKYMDPLRNFFPPYTKSLKFKQVYHIVFAKGGLATTDLRLAEV